MNAKEFTDMIATHVKYGRFACGRPEGQRNEQTIHGLFNGFVKKHINELRKRIDKTDAEEKDGRQQFVPARVIASRPQSRYTPHKHMRSKYARNVFFHQRGIDFCASAIKPLGYGHYLQSKNEIYLREANYLDVDLMSRIYHHKSNCVHSSKAYILV